LVESADLRVWHSHAGLLYINLLLSGILLTHIIISQTSLFIFLARIPAAETQAIPKASIFGFSNLLLLTVESDVTLVMLLKALFGINIPHGVVILFWMRLGSFPK